MIGRVVGPYEVTEMIGRGGMGEVFKARDTKLARDVALKFLPADLAKDPDRLARFEREARVLASLQHQNIAAIYGLEECDGQPVLAMELAEGEDLSLRLHGGALPGDECMKIAQQLSLGLEYAHEQGIVHRDLKPANVKVAGDGRVKILDFGLARAMSTEGGGDSTSGSASYQPTLTQALTGAGTVLGTAAYMSPEQARGYDVDKRSDIWAFGVILYECLTGIRFFEGETATDTLAAVIHKEPDFENMPEGAPTILVQICQRCIVKDPQHRLRDIGEVRVALDSSSSSMVGLSVDQIPAADFELQSKKSGPLPWVLAACFALCAVALGYLGFTGVLGPQPEPERVVRSTVSLSGATRLDLNPSSPGPVAVSPDGRYLAFTATDSGGQTELYVRTLAESEERRIKGTGTACYHFWSPDSRSIAFFTDSGGLEKVDIGGGPVVNITQADNGKGGSWSENGDILYAANHISSIMLVSADGGTGRAVTNLKADQDVRSHRFPKWLPGGEKFIYVAIKRSGGSRRTDSILRVGSADGTMSKDLMPCQTSADYAAGHILFVHDGILMARPLDLESLEFTGPAKPITEGVLAIQAAHLSVMSASSKGVLSYTSGGGGFGNTRLFVIDDEGNTNTVGEPLLTLGLDISSDGKTVALAMPNDQTGTFDIWLLERERNLQTRLTFGPESEFPPVFSPDDKWIIYASDTAGPAHLFRKPVNGGGQAELLLEGESDTYPSDVSPDGMLVAFTEIDSTGMVSVGLFDIEKREIHRRFEDQAFSHTSGRFSPDGNWLAYVSSETGSDEVFVESVEPGHGRWRVSSNSGSSPIWAADGNDLFYTTPDGSLLATEVTISPEGLAFGKTRVITTGLVISSGISYCEDPVTGDIIGLKTSQSRENSSLYLITGWPQLLVEKN